LDERDEAGPLMGRVRLDHTTMLGQSPPRGVRRDSGGRVCIGFFASAVIPPAPPRILASIFAAASSCMPGIA
jgi:hypothetical protein